MTDHAIALTGLIIAVVAAIGTWLALPQLQEWWKRWSAASDPVTLGSLIDAAPCIVALPPGIVQADRKTLEVLLAALPSDHMEWLRTYDFGGSFQWSEVQKLLQYAWRNAGPEHEFLDAELETMRSELIQAIHKFSTLAGRYTSAISRDEDDQVRKIPDQYENGQYSDALFLKKSGEINSAADVVSTRYIELVRRARLKLALNA